LILNYAFDTTWKYKIEPFDPMIPQPTKIIISETFPIYLNQILEENNNRIIYDIYVPDNHYIICSLDITLNSVYPKLQCLTIFQ
jgi:hypothetical protein